MCYYKGVRHGNGRYWSTYTPLSCCWCRALTKTRPLIGVRSSLAPALAIHRLPGVGRVWCALTKGLVCPLQEGRVWRALSRRGGSGVPSPGRFGVPSPGESLVWLPWRVCPLQEGSRSGVPSPGGERVWCSLPSKCYSY